jgi:hypothetical protein
VTPCTRDDLASAIVDAALKKQAPRSELKTHLASCPSCRTSAERARRIADVRDQLEPSDAEVARAVARIRGRRRERPALAPVFGWAAAAVVLIVAATLAWPRGPAVVKHDAPPPLAPIPTAQPAPEAPDVSATFIVRNGTRTRVTADTRLSLAAGERATVELGAEKVELVGPRVVEIVRNPERACGFSIEYPEDESAQAPSKPAPDKQARVKRTAEPAPPEPSAAPEPSAGWERAAQALKARDVPRAENALGELAQSQDAATRDAALLARAQLWISQGRSAEARPVLETLAKTGATPLVRRRAAELLAGSTP